MFAFIADAGLAPWGQAAAIVLGLYLFLSIVLGVALCAALAFLFSWLRDKAELIQKLRPAIDELNESLHAGQEGKPLPADIADNKILQVTTQVPKIANSLPARATALEQKVEQGSDRVAHAVIEFRARTEQAKTIAQAFLLPGIKSSRYREQQRMIRLERQHMLELEHRQSQQLLLESGQREEELPQYEQEMTMHQSYR